MTSAYDLTRQAQADLDEIWEYIARDNPAAANRLIDMLHEKCSMLARQPLIGEPRDELRPGLRSFPARSYVIYYQVANSRVTIARVLHGARDVESLFGADS